jgi:hypothetical protein
MTSHADQHLEAISLMSARAEQEAQRANAVDGDERRTAGVPAAGESRRKENDGDEERDVKVEKSEDECRSGSASPGGLPPPLLPMFEKEGGEGSSGNGTGK